MDFPGSDPTIGLEWEVCLVDLETMNLVSRAPEVMDLMDARHDNHGVIREFMANTVEMVTGIHRTVPDAVAQLRQQARWLDGCARELGLGLMSAGTHPFAHWSQQRLSGKKHYHEIINRTQYWGRQMLIWGIHAHIGVGHRDKVWPIINAVMMHYPHILALSATSPAWEGVDTGYASNRTLLYQQLPTAGMPYQFANWAEWEQFMVDCDRSGVVDHTGSFHFDVRPTAFGTIEIRMADSTLALWQLAAVCAYLHCLVVYFERAWDRGDTLPRLQHWHVAENKWRGARYGMDAIIIIDEDTTEVMVDDDLRRWVDRLSPIAEDLGCLAELRDVLRIIDAGPGYAAMRAAARAAGAAPEPGVSNRDELPTGTFATPDAWRPAVSLAVETLRDSLR